MNELEELGTKIAKLKVTEEILIDEMRVLNKSTDDRIRLLCQLEVVRFEIRPLYEEYKNLMYYKLKEETS